MCLKGMSKTISMHDSTLAAITDAEKTKLRSKLLTDGLTHGQTNGRSHGRMEIWTPISHPTISMCDKNRFLEEIFISFLIS